MKRTAVLTMLAGALLGWPALVTGTACADMIGVAPMVVGNPDGSLSVSCDDNGRGVVDTQAAVVVGFTGTQVDLPPGPSGRPFVVPAGIIGNAPAGTLTVTCRGTQSRTESAAVPVPAAQR